MAVNTYNSKQLVMTVLNKRRKNVLRVDCFSNVLLLCCLCCVTLVSGVDPLTKECSDVKSGFLERGFNASDLLSQPVKGL